MYSIALSVSACIRANTRADLAWVISAEGLVVGDRTQSLALTPGGGKIGSILGGAVDGPLMDIASRHTSLGRVVEVKVNEVEALISGLPVGGSARCVFTPAALLPTELWQMLQNRDPVCLVSDLEGDVIVSTALYTAANIATAGEEIATIFQRGVAHTFEAGEQVITIFWPVTKLAIAGSGPMAEALAEAAQHLGWQVAMAAGVENAMGLMAGLSSIDCAVIMGHDVEISSRALGAALESEAGYIGALGSLKMQENRANWLAYQGITDLKRVHGPAGLPIGAKSPAEVAISILAEAIALQKGARS